MADPGPVEIMCDALYFPPGGVVVNTVVLRSVSAAPLSYKVKLTHPDGMLSRPSKGSLPPGGTAQFDVSLKQSAAELQPLGPRLLVQCSSDLTPDKVMWKHKLPCAFNEAPPGR
eukprot:gene8906-30784_t